MNENINGQKYIILDDFFARPKEINHKRLPITGRKDSTGIPSIAYAKANGRNK